MDSHPAVAILGYARQRGVDLVAMGMHGQGQLAPLGRDSVAAKVLRGADTLVLLYTANSKQPASVQPSPLANEGSTRLSTAR